jgi:hypothetical protein
VTAGMPSILALPTTTATPDPWETVRELRRADAASGDQQPGPRSRQDGARAGLATAATRPLQGGTPPPSRRLGALLSCLGLGGYGEGDETKASVSACGVRLVGNADGMLG